jgi:hypothetical protein
MALPRRSIMKLQAVRICAGLAEVAIFFAAAVLLAVGCLALR